MFDDWHPRMKERASVIFAKKMVEHGRLGGIEWSQEIWGDDITNEIYPVAYRIFVALTNKK